MFWKKKKAQGGYGVPNGGQAWYLKEQPTDNLT